MSKVRSLGPNHFIVVFAMVAIMSLTGCWHRSIHQILVSDSVAGMALEAALTRIGHSYLWGGQGPDLFDCSGLIIWAYSQVVPDAKLRIGPTVVNDATQDDLWRYNVQVIPPDHMRPGDIVFITNDPERITHGGLFIEWVDAEMTEFKFVNASSYYGEVVIDTWPLQGTKRGQWFVGAGRLLVVR